MNIINNKKVLDLIWTSIIYEGGDGDAIWLSKHTSIKDLIALIEEYNLENNTGWEIIVNDKYLLWGKEQEWAIITDDKDFFDSQPEWTTIKIDY